MVDKVHFQSGSTEWETPDWLFNSLDREFNFTLDPCATDENHKCERWYTKEQNGLTRDWSGNVVFVNPPYGRELKGWVRKCYEEYKNGVTVVMLLPARTDTSYFHNYIYKKAKIRFLRGRVHFLKNGKRQHPAPFPSMIAVFKKRKIDFFTKWF